MKISIITPTYNSEKTISDTIESVISQSYPDLEYIIIDGASTDKTREIISGYQNKINIKLLSEPDSGLYEAMNKGIRLASGDIIGILNSDDFYSANNILLKINKTFDASPGIDAVYGDLIYVDENNTSRQTRYWKSGDYNESNIDWGWSIPHPTLFVKRKVYEKLNKIFDTSLSLAADYELTLRLLKINKIKVKYIPEVLVKMRRGGVSGADIKQRIKGWKELRLAWKINSLKIPNFFILRRVLNKLAQFF